MVAAGMTRTLGSSIFKSRKLLIEVVMGKASHLDTSAVLVASKVGLLWDYGMNIFVREYPDDLRVMDEETKLYPFMLSACSSWYGNANLDTIFEMLMACPDAVVEFSGTMKRKTISHDSCVEAKNAKKQCVRK